MAVGDPPAATVERLVRLALDAGGRDNVTAVVVDVQGTPEPAAPDDEEDDGISATTGRRPFRRVEVPPPEPVGEEMIASVPVPERADPPAPVAAPGRPITDVPVGPAPSGGPTVPDPAPELIASLPSELASQESPDPSTEGPK
jgi:hypothetical protein